MAVNVYEGWKGVQRNVWKAYRLQSFRGWDDTFFFFFSPFTLIIDAALRNDGIVSCELGIRTLRNERKSWSS